MDAFEIKIMRRAKEHGRNKERERLGKERDNEARNASIDVELFWIFNTAFSIRP